MRALHLLLIASLSCLTLGCGGSPTTDPLTDAQQPALEALAESSQAAVDAPTGFQPQRPEKAYDDPAAAVTDFLVAVKNGNDASATALLTTSAQQEAWTNGLAISSEGFAEAEFEVSEVEFLNQATEAHVMSLWSDVTPQGQRKSFQCVWLLRKEAHGWCIYGMATKFLDDAPPVVLNFENQNEMQRRQKWAEQQIAKRRQLNTQTREPIQQATRPTTGTVK